VKDHRLLLVGSVPYESAERVLLAASDILGAHLDAIPDGEVLDRRYWVLRMAFQVFNGHAALETIHRPNAPVGGERLIPASREDVWQFRLRPGIEAISFDMPGWRLGYAKDAQNSYALFAALKREGRIRREARFQVSVPAVNSVCNPSIFGTDASELAIVRAGFQESLVAEVTQICAIVPADELALQYDCSFEVTAVHGATGLPIEGSIERNVAQFGPLTEIVPDQALLGFHLCFGTFRGWPRFAPDDLKRTVELANAIAAASRRRLDWMHIPGLDTSAESFYAPLANLRLDGARVYLGLVHSMGSFAERLAVAQLFLPAFGLAAYCGLGRLEPEAVEASFHDHLLAIALADQAAGE
jgi:hypothetical protein